MKPRYRIAVDHSLAAGETFQLQDNPAHYIAQVGDTLCVFNKKDGEWVARISEVKKRAVMLVVETCLRPSAPAGFSLTVCFAPIKGGRLETIIEKATELGATVLQPVLTARTIVDKVNLERAEAIAREAAEQCSIDWPEIREPVKLVQLLGSWPENIPLIYGDESGASEGFDVLKNEHRVVVSRADAQASGDGGEPPPHTPAWGIFVGPEGGFTPDEFAMLQRLDAAQGVSLGPRILRADTAVITLTALTLAAWGDWQERPRFGKQA